MSNPSEVRRAGRQVIRGLVLGEEAQEKDAYLRRDKAKMSDRIETLKEKAKDEAGKLKEIRQSTGDEGFLGTLRREPRNHRQRGGLYVQGGMPVILRSVRSQRG